LKSDKPGINATGTLKWKAPEYSSDMQKTQKSLISIALGWVLWEIITQKLPFEDAGEE